jgi:cyclophilin family peptidyl-prolyl cis-trans isomerase
MSKQWNKPPEMVIDPKKRYQAVFKTDKGDFTVDLFAAKAPKTVNNLVFLAREGFYDNTTFHRVIKGFMAQAGDPTGSGRGGPGYKFGDEFDRSLRFDREGYLAMANAGPGTNGSQFFITFGPQPHLNDHHTIFGEVTDGMDVVKAISERDPMRAKTPGDTIKTIEIIEA